MRYYWLSEDKLEGGSHSAGWWAWPQVTETMESETRDKGGTTVNWDSNDEPTIQLGLSFLMRGSKQMQMSLLHKLWISLLKWMAREIAIQKNDLILGRGRDLTL